MHEGPVELQDDFRLYVAGQECFAGQKGWILVGRRLRRGHLVYVPQLVDMPWCWAWEDSLGNSYMVTALRPVDPHRSRLRLTDESAYAGARRYPEVKGRDEGRADDGGRYADSVGSGGVGGHS